MRPLYGYANDASYGCGEGSVYVYADPLCQLLAAEGEENEAEALFSVEIAYWVHVTVCPSNDGFFSPACRVDARVTFS